MSIGVFHTVFLYVWYCWCVFESSFLLLFLTYCALIPSVLCLPLPGLYAPKYCWYTFWTPCWLHLPSSAPLRLLLLLQPPPVAGPGWLLSRRLSLGFPVLLTLPSCCADGTGWHRVTCLHLPSIPARLSSPLYPSPQAGPSSPRPHLNWFHASEIINSSNPPIWWQPPTCPRPQGFHSLTSQRPKTPPSCLCASSWPFTPSPPFQHPALDGSHSPQFLLLCLGYRRQSSAQEVPGHSLLSLLSKLSKHLKWSRPSHLDPQSPYPPPRTWLTSPGLSACLYITPDTLPSWSSHTPWGHPTEGKDPSPQPDLSPQRAGLGSPLSLAPAQRRHWKLLAGQVSGCLAKGPKGTCPQQNPEWKWTGSDTCPHPPQARLPGRHTYDGGGGTLRPGDGAVRDPQGEGFAVALICFHLPPDSELAHGTPASGETDELDLWRFGEGPGHDDRFIGWLWTMANLEKEAKAAGCWQEAGFRHGQRPWPHSWGWGGILKASAMRETRNHAVHWTPNRDTSGASAGSKVTGLPGTFAYVAPPAWNSLCFSLPGELLFILQNTTWLYPSSRKLFTLTSFLSFAWPRKCPQSSSYLLIPTSFLPGLPDPWAPPLPQLSLVFWKQHQADCK